MPDRRLFDSSSMTPPPEPRGEAMTCNVETPAKPWRGVETWRMPESLMKVFPYEGPPRSFRESK